jgi:hypothetical protein
VRHFAHFAELLRVTHPNEFRGAVLHEMMDACLEQPPPVGGEEELLHADG